MDKISAESRSKNMSHIKGKNTKPEILVRKALSRLGYRYRIQYHAPGHPDIAFPSKRIAIFVHGCFWHGHNCKYAHIPKTNTKFWSNKILNNIRRHTEITNTLESLGWKVITIWECKIHKNVDKEIARVTSLISLI